MLIFLLKVLSGFTLVTALIGYIYIGNLLNVQYNDGLEFIYSFSMYDVFIHIHTDQFNPHHVL